MTHCIILEIHTWGSTRNRVPRNLLLQQMLARCRRAGHKTEDVDLSEDWPQLQWDDELPNTLMRARCSLICAMGIARFTQRCSSKGFA